MFLLKQFHVFLLGGIFFLAKFHKELTNRTFAELVSQAKCAIKTNKKVYHFEWI